MCGSASIVHIVNRDFCVVRTVVLGYPQEVAEGISALAGERH